MKREYEISNQLKLLKLLDKQRMILEFETQRIAQTYSDLMRSGFNTDRLNMTDAEYNIPDDLLFSKIEELEQELKELNKEGE